MNPVTKKHKANKAVVHTVNQVCICQICLDTPRDNIYQCEEGHIICATCKKTYTASSSSHASHVLCPTCKIDTKFANRNAILEQIIESLELSCKYQSNGCDHKSSKVTRLRHEMECVFRLKCLFPECKFRYNDRLSLMKHIKEEHLHSWYKFGIWHKFFHLSHPVLDFENKTWCCGIPLKSEWGLYLLRIHYDPCTKTIRLGAFLLYSLDPQFDHSTHETTADSIIIITSVINIKSKKIYRHVPVFVNDVNPKIFEKLDVNFDKFDFDYFDFDDEPACTKVPSNMFNCRKFLIDWCPWYGDRSQSVVHHLCPHFKHD